MIFCSDQSGVTVIGCPVSSQPVQIPWWTLPRHRRTSSFQTTANSVTATVLVNDYVERREDRRRPRVGFQHPIHQRLDGLHIVNRMQRKGLLIIWLYHQRMANE